MHKYFAAGALALSMVLGGNAAQAADLGGDCCADLEERINELEAAAVRSGNRRLKVQLYGQVNTAVLWFDNGVDSDIYQVDNDLSSTRVGIKGKGKINSDLSAGMKIEFEIQIANSDDVEQFDDDGGNFIAARKAEWWLKSKSLGKLSVGQGSQAIDGIMTIDLSKSNIIDHGQLVDIGEDFHFGATGLDVENFMDDFDGSRINRVRYDSPTFAGFWLSASVGEDDLYDVAVRYKGELGQFKVAAGVGYEYTDDERPDGDERTKLIGAASILHMPTGLFLTGATGEEDYDTAAATYTEDQYYLKGGISTKNFSSLGRTVIYGSYAEHDNSENRGATATRIGAGIVQRVKSVGMEFYLGWRQFEVDNGETVVGAGYDDVNIVTSGARLKF